MLNQIPSVFSPVVCEVLYVACVLWEEFLNGINAMLLEHPGNVSIVKALSPHLTVELIDKGMIGDSATSLVGSLLVTKMFLAALQRAVQLEAERRDFYLYIDECQNLATPIFASILSEARKYRLNLILGHQFLAQIPREIKAAVLGNVGSLVCFRLGAEDAGELAPEFAPEFSALDLENLGAYQIALKLAVDGLTSRPFSARTLTPRLVRENEGRRAIIIQASRQKYGTRRAVIEDKILRWLIQPASQNVKGKP